MRQKITLLTKTLLLLCALMAGSGSAWADEVIVISEDFTTNNTIPLVKEAGWTLPTNGCSMGTLNERALQIASSKYAASAQTPSFSSLVGTTATLTFKHKSSGNSSRTLTVTGNSCKVNGNAYTTINVPSDISSTTINITEASTTSSITFSAAKGQGTIIDDVVVYYTKTPTSPLASIALSGEYPTSFAVGDEFSHEGMTVTATYENNETSDVTSKASFSGYDMSQAGSQTVTVSYTDSEVTKTASYNITVKAQAGLSFTPSSVTVAIGGEETVSFIKATDATVNFVIADETIATYDATTGKIAGLKAGATTITATSAETDGYAAGEAVCAITVTDPTWIDFTAQGYSNADDVTTLTGLNGTVTFAVGSNSYGNYPKWYDSGAAVRLYTGNTITVSAKNGYLLSSVEFSVTSGSMLAESFDETVSQVGKTNEFTLDTPSSEITYTTSSNFRIDKVKITLATLTKTVSSAGWATYAPEYAVEFGEDEAFIIDVADDTETVLAGVSSVPAGTPVLLKGAGEHTMNVVTSSSTDVSENCLKVSDGTVTKDNNVYVLANDKYGVGFYLWIGENAIPEGKIYMEPNITNSRSFISLGGEATGVAAIETNNESVKNEVYNFNGQRIGKPSKGLYIVNGKKVIVK